MDISVVIPVFNEEENLRPLHEKIAEVFGKLNMDFEIIYIDDGSTDRGFDILKEIRSRAGNVKLIRFDKNYGKTSAIDAGFKSASGEFVLTMDSDLQHDPADIIRIVEGLRGNDVVACYRINRKEADGYLKHIIAKASNFVRNAVLGERIRDCGCFFAGYKNKCLKGLNLHDGFEFFLYSLMHMRGYKIKEMGIRVYPRRSGRSKYKLKYKLNKTLSGLLALKHIKTNSLIYKKAQE
jgi:glycosyltransferase involved in cell wall biosynthesis